MKMKKYEKNSQLATKHEKVGATEAKAFATSNFVALLKICIFIWSYVET